MISKSHPQTSKFEFRTLISNFDVSSLPPPPAHLPLCHLSLLVFSIFSFFWGCCVLNFLENSGRSWTQRGTITLFRWSATTRVVWYSAVSMYLCVPCCARHRWKGKGLGTPRWESDTPFLGAHTSSCWTDLSRGRHEEKST